MRFLSFAILLICLVPASLLAGDDNPYKNAKVGDWVEYKYTGKDWRAPDSEGKEKMTVIAKDGNEVIYEVTAAYAVGKGRPAVVVPTQKVKIDLTKPHDPIRSAVLAKLLRNPQIKATDIKATKLGEGREKVKIGDKEYETKWVHMKYSANFNDPNSRPTAVTAVVTAKAWLSRDVPLSGVAMMETFDGGTSKIVFIRSGSGGK